MSLSTYTCRNIFAMHSYLCSFVSRLKYPGNPHLAGICRTIAVEDNRLFNSPVWNKPYKSNFNFVCVL